MIKHDQTFHRQTFPFKDHHLLHHSCLEIESSTLERAPLLDTIIQQAAINGQ